MALKTKSFDTIAAVSLALVTVLFASATSTLSGCRGKETNVPELEATPTGDQEPDLAYITTSDEVMSTLIEVTVPAAGSDELTANEAAELVFRTFREVESWASEWQSGAALAEVNRLAGGPPVEVPQELVSLTERGVRLGELTGGAFDISWAALWGVWDFKTETPAIPSEALLEERRSLINYASVSIDTERSTIQLPNPGMKLGLGGIAKGYALERSAEELRAAGINSFTISAGGHIIAVGEKMTEPSNPRPWRVGIRAPRGGAADYFAVVEARDQSVSTSGDYERFFELGGQRYHHIIDPRTGFPSQAAMAATVVSSDATEADALSTALMVLGVAGLDIVNEMEGVEALVIDSDGAVRLSDGLIEGEGIFFTR